MEFPHAESEFTTIVQVVKIISRKHISSANNSPEWLGEDWCQIDPI